MFYFYFLLLHNYTIRIAARFVFLWKGFMAKRYVVSKYFQPPKIFIIDRNGRRFQNDRAATPKPNSGAEHSWVTLIRYLVHTGLRRWTCYCYCRYVTLSARVCRHVHADIAAVVRFQPVCSFRLIILFPVELSLNFIDFFISKKLFTVDTMSSHKVSDNIRCLDGVDYNVVKVSKFRPKRTVFRSSRLKISLYVLL